jgi:hypothetical protein
LNEPRPFSNYPPLVPYVFYTDYTDTEIEEAVELFYRAGLIKIISSVFPSETRFYISDDWLVGLIMIIRLVQEILINKIIAKVSVGI